MPDAAPLFERLALLDDPDPGSGAFNMALDEVLLGGLQDMPVLRIYRWERATVSFGFFTPYRKVAEAYPDWERVRRWTGGGVVEHGKDLTYSLLIPRSVSLTNGPAEESYRLIHEAVMNLLNVAGTGKTSFAQGAAPVQDSASSGCFVRPVRYDLLFQGEKIGGAAQRRTRRGLLHQGSIKLPPDGLCSSEQLIQAMPGAFARHPEKLGVGVEIKAEAIQLADEKYASEGWMRRV